MGCLLSIDSDAHNTARARLRPLGHQPGAPRVGGAASTSLNTRSRADLLAWVARQAGARVTDRLAYHRARWTTIELARRDLALAAVTIVGLSRLVEPPARLAGRGLPARRDAARDPAGPRRRGAPGRSRPRRPDRVADPAGRRRGGLPRRDPARAVRAVARAGPARSRGCSSGGRWRSRPGSMPRPTGLDADDRTAVLVTTLLVAFLAFIGCRGDGARAGSSSRRRAAGRRRCPRPNLLVLAAGDALVAFLLGYRAAALRVGRPCATRCGRAATYAVAIAIGAAALRAMEIPRLIGPALLTLAFYLWDAFHAAAPGAPARRRAGSGRRACSRSSARRHRLEPAASDRWTVAARDSSRLTIRGQTVLENEPAPCSRPALPRAPTRRARSDAPRKDDPPVTFPDIETDRAEPRQPDPPEAPARRAGDRPGLRRPVGRGRRHEPQAPRARARTPRRRTGWPRRSGSWASWRAAREHYQTALALDPTNRIAERNIDRLKILIVAAGEKTVPAPGRQQGARSASSSRRPARPASRS